MRDSNYIKELFRDIPEALENNFNLPFRCSFKPNQSKPILPRISSSKKDPNEILKVNSYNGLKDKFKTIFNLDWVSLGPVVNSARVESIQVDEKNPGTMYVAFGLSLIHI